jgi:hypothetical protein
LNPSEIERTDVKPWFLYRTKEGAFRWLSEDIPPHGARFIFSCKAPTVAEAIAAAKVKGKLP